MKKLTAVLLIAVCCIILSACNSGENETKITSQVTTSAVTTAKETIQPATTAAEQTTGTETTKAIEETTDLQEEVTQAQNDEPSEHADEKTLGNTPVSVDWEDNEAVEALKDLCRNQPLTIQMSMYGGFEQVGSIGTALPQNDVQTTTTAGDIVLYSGDQMVVFYGSNTWAYTRLGHITDKTQAELAELLSNGNVTVTLSY